MFQIEIINDTANLVDLQKKIPYKCMVKLYNWSLHCPSTCTCKVNIFT